MKRWYEELFADFAESYDREVFVQGTSGECDFLEKEIGHARSVPVLDIGCGTGRHSIELARRGYRVTGLDLSESQLKRAREKARTAGVDVDFRLADAREIEFEGTFGLVLILCEGGFSLMETDEMNYRILAGAARALRPGGKLILTVLNALLPLKYPMDGGIETGPGRTTHMHGFDLMTFRTRSTLKFTDDSGVERTIECDERHFAPVEIRWWLNSLGLDKVAIHGCRLGAFSRNDPLAPNDIEMLVIAEKTASGEPPLRA